MEIDEGAEIEIGGRSFDNDVCSHLLSQWYI